jgi:hypothetical protein
MVVQVCNPSTWEVEAEFSKFEGHLSYVVCLRPAWSTCLKKIAKKERKGAGRVVRKEGKKEGRNAGSFDEENHHLYLPQRW